MNTPASYSFCHTTHSSLSLAFLRTNLPFRVRQCQLRSVCRRVRSPVRLIRPVFAGGSRVQRGRLQRHANPERERGSRQPTASQRPPEGRQRHLGVTIFIFWSGTYGRIFLL